MPPCELIKVHLMMMAFVHTQIEPLQQFKQIYNSDFHEQVGNRIFFHDRLIEHWMCDVDLDVVSETFSSKESSNYTLECKRFQKQNVFIILDDVTWNSENGECRLMIYIYDGDYCTSGLRKELIRQSE